MVGGGRVSYPPLPGFLAVELVEPLEGDPLCKEKLSPILGIRRVDGFAQGVEMVSRLTSLTGQGHSCGLYSGDEDRVATLAESVSLSRIMVNQSTGQGNSGSLTNGMPFSSTLSCGTWAGGVLSENVTWRHFVNWTWVSRPIQRSVPCLDDLLAPFKRARRNGQRRSVS